MMYTDDPIADFNRREQEEADWLRSRPVCAKCGEPIEDETLLEINGDLFHIDCAIQKFEQDTENYVEK